MRDEAWITVALPMVMSNKNCLEANIVSESVPAKGGLGLVQTYVEVKLKEPFIRFVCPDVEAEEEVLSFFRNIVLSGQDNGYGIRDIIDGGKNANNPESTK